MKKRITDFFIKNKYAVTWTGLYIMMMWAVLYGLFHFNMFSATQWHHLMRAHLYGFPGFVFGILVLGAIPMYVATTMIIVRTGKPIFTLPKFKILDRVATFITAPMPTKKQPDSDKPAVADVPPESEPEPAPLPANLPGELRAAFRNARQKTSLIVTETKSPQPDIPPAPAASDPLPNTPTDLQMEPDGLPLPPDFDFAPSDPTESVPSFAPSFSPVFSDISFGDDEPDTTPAPVTPNKTDVADELGDVVKHLNDAGRHVSVSDGVAICDDMAIVAHTDSDFWIADDADWFATGKQKPSPITTVMNVADAQNLTPVLYLGSQNIMDIDTHIDQWKSQGIRVITDLGDL